MIIHDFNNVKWGNLDVLVGCKAMCITEFSSIKECEVAFLGQIIP